MTPALLRNAAASRAVQRRPASFANAVIVASATAPSSEATSTSSTSSPSSSSSSPASSSSAKSPPPPVSWKLKLLHDSDCPLCEREVSMLKRRDSERTNSICFVDVADPGYAPGENCGVDYETAMRTIHGIVPSSDGKELVVITGVDVFRKAYELVGLGWVYAFLDVPVLKKMATAAYDAWARIRLPLTGRPTLEVVLAEKKTCRDAGEK